MVGPCWEIGGSEEETEEEVEIEVEVEVETTNRASQPAKNLTPEEQAQIAESQ